MRTFGSGITLNLRRWQPLPVTKFQYRLFFYSTPVTRYALLDHSRATRPAIHSSFRLVR